MADCKNAPEDERLGQDSLNPLTHTERPPPPKTQMPPVKTQTTPSSQPKKDGQFNDCGQEYSA
jgi:hypothetical protein